MQCGPHYGAIAALPKYGDFFQAADSIIEERFSNYSTQMKNSTKDMNSLNIDCRAKFRSAEIHAERNSIKKIDKFNTDWKHLQQKIEKLIEQRDDCELDEHENDMNVCIELLKEDLLDIEESMGTALRIAYVQYENELKRQLNKLVENTGEFMGQTNEQVQGFAIEVRVHCLEQFDITSKKALDLDEAGDE